MTSIPINISAADVRLLTAFLGSKNRPENTLSFHELQGFLFAVASSPETIAPSEWMPVISDEEDLGLADEGEAQKILGLIMAVYNQVNRAVLEHSSAMPVACAFDDDTTANFKDDSSISQWSRGFVAGHDWLLEIWDDYLDGYPGDEIDDELGASLMVLTCFASRQLAQAYYAEGDGGDNEIRSMSFEKFAQTMVNLFPDAMASYANIGRTIFETNYENETPVQEPAKSTKIGRNEPCTCGSGKKYKKCCGSNLH